jgi:hypothetical protein
VQPKAYHFLLAIIAHTLPAYFSQKSKQHIDQQYAVNAVANAVLVQRLSVSAEVSRFVLVSSEAHRWAKCSEIDASLHGLMNPPAYTTSNAFDQYSRYAAVLWGVVECFGVLWNVVECCVECFRSCWFSATSISFICHPHPPSGASCW